MISSIRTTLLFMIKIRDEFMRLILVVVTMDNNVVLINKIEALRGQPTYQMNEQR